MPENPGLAAASAFGGFALAGVVKNVNKQEQMQKVKAFPAITRRTAILTATNVAAIAAHLIAKRRGSSGEITFYFAAGVVANTVAGAIINFLDATPIGGPGVDSVLSAAGKVPFLR